MRIVTRLATAGESGFLSMPALRHPAEHYAKDGRALDQDAVRREFAQTPGIQMSSDDAGDTLSFAVELLDRMRRCMNGLMKVKSDVSYATVRHSPDEPPPPKTAAQRRFDKGRTTFVRVDIRRNGQAPGFRVKLSAMNPKEVVGRSEEFAQIYAQAFADNIVAIADALAEEQPGTVVVMQEGEGCEGVFAEARKRNDKVLAQMRHADCPNRINGYCSPCKPDCELYHNGKCKYD